ncbi:MAG TPA: mycofactocin biosynthesis glycosyltransferase MftF [Beutenbergiaceae bacterium]|nr:mycofactocin biosynthesis glycosyltransferase MftF [Beutenbergiaceae bacterium]
MSHVKHNLASWGPPTFPLPPARTSSSTAFTQNYRIAWTTGVKFRAGKVTIGGSPWAVTLLPPEVQPFAHKLFAAGRSGLVPETETEQRAAIFLLDRGIADPLPLEEPPATATDDVEIVIPVYRDVQALRKALESVADQGIPITVVDDKSPPHDALKIKQATQEFGARLIVHDDNQGPGGARNTGFQATSAAFIAFMDSDVVATPGWVQRLRPVFDDPKVGAVAPRVRPDVHGDSCIELYEETRSELDMGPHPSHVVYGVPVGWLPTASVIVRRTAVTTPPFEPGMRVGEDVDLFWRMEQAGWSVRYATDVVNHHRVRNSFGDFAGRRAMYGSSAAELEKRHPRRLIPANPSLSGLAVLALLSSKKPAVRMGAVGVGVYEFLRYRRMLRDGIPTRVVAEMTLRSLSSDLFWMGHLLRREWWPLGWTILAASTRSRRARFVAAAMAWEPFKDHILGHTRLGPLKSLAMRLVDDASYGSGVIRGAWRNRIGNVVTPRVHFPGWPKKAQDDFKVTLKR